MLLKHILINFQLQNLFIGVFGGNEQYVKCGVDFAFSSASKVLRVKLR